MQQYEFSQNGISLTGATAKSLVEIQPVSTGGANIKHLGVWFKSVTTTDVPVLVEYGVDITGGTTATGTSLTAANAAIWDKGVASVDPTSVLKHTITTENTWSPASTSADPYVSLYVSPLGGYEVFFPLGEELFVVSSGLFRIRCTAPQAQTAAFMVRWEE